MRIISIRDFPQQRKRMGLQPREAGVLRCSFLVRFRKVRSKVPEGSSLGRWFRSKFLGQVPEDFCLGRSSGSGFRQGSGRLGSWYACSESGSRQSFGRSNRGEWFLYRFGMELLQVTAVWFRKVQRRCSETCAGSSEADVKIHFCWGYHRSLFYFFLGFLR